jgi:branched-chain amino acid transport system substrate-binding protein
VALGIFAIGYLLPGFGSAQQADAGTIRIYSSVPMNGFQSIVHGAQMAFAEANNQAGSFKIDFVPLNGAKEIGGKWSAEVELANARRAVEDPDAMLYIGTYNSGAAKISIPVLNRVNMAMISPGNTYPGLTKPGTGTAGEPWTYFPLGVRNYFRVVPADDLQGAAAAAFAANTLGAKTVYVLDDRELYGHGIAVIFARSATDLGLQVLGGPESIDVRANDYASLAAKIMQNPPDLVYFGGITANHAALVLRDLQEVGYSGFYMGADGMADQEFIDQATTFGAQSKSRIYSTLVGLPAAKLTGPGAQWYERYISRYPNDDNKDFAPFGYEAARVAISAIERAGKKDREAIRAAVAETNTSLLKGENILGEWQFDANGDTSLVTISVQELTTQWTYDGLMSYDPEAKTWTFQGE